MIYLHSPVKMGKTVNPNGQFEICELILRGTTNVVVAATSQEEGEEIPGGLEVDLPSFIEFCKRVLVETGTLPKWFFFGMILDADHSQVLTYFSPSKEKFFSDIYNEIRNNLRADLPVADVETVVKHFFEQSPNFRFNYLVIPLDTLLSGSQGGRMDPIDIRL